MILYRRKKETDMYERAPSICQIEKQEPGWLYCYFANDEAAKIGKGFH